MVLALMATLPGPVIELTSMPVAPPALSTTELLARLTLAEGASENWKPVPLVPPNWTELPKIVNCEGPAVVTAKPVSLPPLAENELLAIEIVERSPVEALSMRMPVFDPPVPTNVFASAVADRLPFQLRLMPAVPACELVNELESAVKLSVDPSLPASDCTKMLSAFDDVNVFEAAHERIRADLVDAEPNIGGAVSRERGVADGELFYVESVHPVTRRTGDLVVGEAKVRNVLALHGHTV